MRHLCLRLFVLSLAWGILAIAPSAAQENAAEGDAPAVNTAWPEVDLNPTGQGPKHTIDRGDGWYLSVVKLGFVWLIFLAWVATTDWVSRDTRELRMNYGMWNSIVFFVFLAAFLLLFLIPSFLIAFMLYLLAYAGSLGAYIYVRNSSVEAHQRVLTPDHLRHVFSQRAGKLGVKVDAEKKADYEKGAPVEFEPRGAEKDVDNQANLVFARQSPGFVPTKEIVADLIQRRGDALMLDYTKEAVGVRMQIDGVWHPGEPRDRESGDLILAVLKTLAGVNAKERRAKQEGEFGVQLNGAKFAGRLTSQGTQTGERAILKLEGRGQTFASLEELGMREKMRERVFELLNAEDTFFLFSAMPGGGLTTTMNVALDEIDRLMRNFVEIEDAQNRQSDIENIDVTTYDGAAGESPATILPKLIRTYPDVIIVRDLTNAETVQILCQQPAEKRMIIGSIRAKEAVEALLRVLMLKAPAKEFAPAVTAVLNVRLIRKLCDQCKVGFEPSPEMLKKLGLPAGRVKALYREPKAEEREEVCEKCSGVGYHGRTAIFELLEVGAKTREVLIKSPKLDLLKKAAKIDGHRNLQEEGILLVAKGVTSISELQRVLKQ